ncbi:MAG: substrate-binding domain-containing protein [Chloroflexota bacterium]|nr:substrate-binding domain-containing protein [Chloroflexota bacterium]
MLVACASSAPDPEPIVIGLVTKTEENPFFVTLREAAEDLTQELRFELRSYSGEYDGDNESQVQAIEALVDEGAQAILLTPSDPVALVDSVARARRAGLLVIALDTPFARPDQVDATIATDNYRAGQLVGRWARARLGVDAARAGLVTLDLSAEQITVDVQRHQGMLSGFGIEIGDSERKYDERDPRVLGAGATAGSLDGGRREMLRLARKLPVIRLVYAINEPAARGAREALEQLGRANDILIVTIDGSCSGVADVAAGRIGATAAQDPVRMVRLALETALAHLRTGSSPHISPDTDFVDSGVTLVTDEPVAGLPSIVTSEALERCWGD